MKFYQKTWFMWLMLFIFSPLGIFLLWKDNYYKKKSRVILTAVFSVYFIVVAFGQGDEEPNLINTDTNKTEASTVLDEVDNQKSEETTNPIEESKELLEPKAVENQEASNEENVEKAEAYDSEEQNNKSIQELNNSSDKHKVQEVKSTNEYVQESFEGYRKIEVDGGDQSGQRESNVVVDIGFGDREYYAFTNEYGQLVRVTAKRITLQDETKEKVLSTGRYYYDEAKVPGVESPYLDEGHVIADSLGGVSNAYNITPQNSTLNRHGDQAYMEKVIRDAGGCTDFEAIITYPSTTTQIPSHYSFTYTINGNKIHDEFDNVNPDEVNKNIIENEVKSDNETLEEGNIRITKLDKTDEYIVIKNFGNNEVNLGGWKIVSVLGNQSFIIPSFVLMENQSVKIGDSAKNSDVDFHWLDGRGTWNNSKSDPAELYDNKGNLIYRFDN